MECVHKRNGPLGVSLEGVQPGADHPRSNRKNPDSLSGMHMETMNRYKYLDRQEWSRVLFYTDLVVMAVFVVSLVLLVVNAYVAGFRLEAADYAASHRALWNVAIATGFMVACLAWIFFRFFKHQYEALRRTPL
jgi:hypothetical protein